MRAHSSLVVSVGSADVQGRSSAHVLTDRAPVQLLICVCQGCACKPTLLNIHGAPKATRMTGPTPKRKSEHHVILRTRHGHGLGSISIPSDPPHTNQHDHSRQHTPATTRHADTHTHTPNTDTLNTRTPPPPKHHTQHQHHTPSHRHNKTQPATKPKRNRQPSKAQSPPRPQNPNQLTTHDPTAPKQPPTPKPKISAHGFLRISREEGRGKRRKEEEKRRGEGRGEQRKENISTRVRTADCIMHPDTMLCNLPV